MASVVGSQMASIPTPGRELAPMNTPMNRPTPGSVITPMSQVSNVSSHPVDFDSWSISDEEEEMEFEGTEEQEVVEEEEEQEDAQGDPQTPGGWLRMSLHGSSWKVRPVLQPDCLPK